MQNGLVCTNLTQVNVHDEPDNLIDRRPTLTCRQIILRTTLSKSNMPLREAMLLCLVKKSSVNAFLGDVHTARLEYMCFMEKNFTNLKTHQDRDANIQNAPENPICPHLIRSQHIQESQPFGTYANEPHLTTPTGLFRRILPIWNFLGKKR